MPARPSNLQRAKKQKASTIISSIDSLARRKTMNLPNTTSMVTLISYRYEDENNIEGINEAQAETDSGQIVGHQPNTFCVTRTFQSSHPNRTSSTSTPPSNASEKLGHPVPLENLSILGEMCYTPHMYRYTNISNCECI